MKSNYEIAKAKPHEARRMLWRGLREMFSSNYMGRTEFPGYMHSGIGKNRDSDPIDVSNFRVAKEIFEEAGIATYTPSFGHWAVGWTEHLFIPATIKATKVAQDILDRIDSYPILDEDDCALEEEKGQCDSCQAMMINGLRCHETGCPREARLKQLKAAIDRAEEMEPNF